MRHVRGLAPRDAFAPRGNGARGLVRAAREVEVAELERDARCEPAILRSNAHLRRDKGRSGVIDVARTSRQVAARVVDLRTLYVTS